MLKTSEKTLEKALSGFSKAVTQLNQANEQASAEIEQVENQMGSLEQRKRKLSAVRDKAKRSAEAIANLIGE